MSDNSVHFQKDLMPDIIRPAIVAVEKNIDDNFKKEVGLCNYLDNPKYITKLSDCYESKRDWLKNAYFGDSVDDNSLIDMHKISAVLCRSILAFKPFKFDVEKANQFKANFENELNKNSDKTKSQIKDELLKWTIKNYWCNYKAAVDVALLATFYDLVGKLGDMKKDPSTNTFGINVKDVLIRLNDNGIDTYRKGTTPIPLSHESFYRSLVINLAINDTNRRDFDYLAMTTICFQIQQYSVLMYHYNKRLELPQI